MPNEFDKYDSKQVNDKIYDLVEEQLGVEKSRLSSDSNFINDLGADSLDMAELIMAIEEEFFLTVQEDECEGIDTIQQCIDKICEILKREGRLS